MGHHVVLELIKMVSFFFISKFPVKNIYSYRKLTHYRKSRTEVKCVTGMLWHSLKFISFMLLQFSTCILIIVILTEWL